MIRGESNQPGKSADPNKGGVQKQVKAAYLATFTCFYQFLSSAEAARFELADTLRYRQFSKLVVSATHPHFLVQGLIPELRGKDMFIFLNKQSFFDRI